VAVDEDFEDVEERVKEDDADDKVICWLYFAFALPEGEAYRHHTQVGEYKYNNVNK